jgi:hypothetical protein
MTTHLLLRALLSVAFLVVTPTAAFGKQPNQQGTNAFIRQGRTYNVGGGGPPPTVVNQKSSSRPSSDDADIRFAVQYPIEKEALQESTTGNVLSYGHGRCDFKVTPASALSMMEPKGTWWGVRYSDLLYV